ncbi:MAG: hypothetical protein ABI243_12915 [Lapillicoccus sp.]
MSTSGDQVMRHDPADLARFVSGTTREITTAAGGFGLSMSRTAPTSPSSTATHRHASP